VDVLLAVIVQMRRSMIRSEKPERVFTCDEDTGVGSKVRERDEFATRRREVVARVDSWTCSADEGDG
jgi:hypothetical protein